MRFAAWVCSHLGGQAQRRPAIPSSASPLCPAPSPRLQSRRAYAEIRPRVKGRFVTPEEYAVYQAQAAAEKAGVPYVPASAMTPPAPVEEDAVVPMPSFVF